MEEPARGKAIGVGVHGHRAANDAQKGGAEAGDFGLRKVRRGPLGTDGGLIENLVGDPVSHSREGRLIEEDRLDGRFSRANLEGKLSSFGKAEERIVTETEKRRLVSWIMGQAKPAEPPGVGEREAAMVIESEFELEEAWRCRGGGKKVKAAGHAEMKNRPGLAVELEPEVLAESPRVLDGGAQKRLLDPPGGDPGQNDRVRRTPGKDDSASFELSPCFLPRGFDFGQFRQ